MTNRSSQISLATLAGAAGVALGSFLLALPEVLMASHVSPDTIEFIGIAHNWVHGRGWVDPVLYSTYLQGALPPIQGMVVRPPAISLMMAPAIALGASLPQLQLVQSAVASLIGGGAVVFARRSVSLAAAIAFGIALSWSPSWLEYSSQVLSEPLAIGALLLPSVLVRSCLDEYLVSDGLLGRKTLPVKQREPAAAWISKVFDVNPIVARIRLEHLYPLSEEQQLTL